MSQIGNIARKLWAKIAATLKSSLSAEDREKLAPRAGLPEE
jgi:hypothetical protein